MLCTVLCETVALSAIGIAFGLLIALAATRALWAFLFALTPHDPAMLAGTAAVLLFIALVAGVLPGRHAAAVDPVSASGTSEYSI